MTRKAPVLRIVLGILVIAALAVVPAALGGKPAAGGGTTGPSSLKLAMVNDQTGNGLPNYGDTITFNVSTNATAEPHVSVQCNQGRTLVYSAATGYYAGYPWPWTQNMTLASSSWTGGAADCTAKLYYFSGKKTVTLTTLVFHVDA